MYLIACLPESMHNNEAALLQNQPRMSRGRETKHLTTITFIHLFEQRHQGIDREKTCSRQNLSWMPAVKLTCICPSDINIYIHSFFLLHLHWTTSFHLLILEKFTSVGLDLSAALWHCLPPDITF